MKTLVIAILLTVFIVGCAGRTIRTENGKTCVDEYGAFMKLEPQVINITHHYYSDTERK